MDFSAIWSATESNQDALPKDDLPAPYTSKSSFHGYVDDAILLPPESDSPFLSRGTSSESYNSGSINSNFDGFGSAGATSCFDGYPSSPSSGSTGASKSRKELSKKSSGGSAADNIFMSTRDRTESFVEGCRVYHAIFGTGYVLKNDGVYLNIQFDDLKYGSMKLKSFHAVPKMVLLPN